MTGNGIIKDSDNRDASNTSNNDKNNEWKNEYQ